MIADYAKLIPDEVVEAAARGLREAVKVTLSVNDKSAFDELPPMVQDAYRTEARAALAAGLAAWLGADVETFKAKLLGERDYLILPLPQEKP